MHCKDSYGTARKAAKNRHNYMVQTGETLPGSRVLMRRIFWFLLLPLAVLAGLWFGGSYAYENRLYAPISDMISDETKDKLRDPVILAEAHGLKYGIEFYGCRLGRNCATILFRTRLFDGRGRSRHISGNDLDDWNGSKLFGRAVLDDSGRPVLEHPVAMGPGLPQDTMRANFEAWVTALEQFANHVDFK